jgi:hypothetical protein
VGSRQEEKDTAGIIIVLNFTLVGFRTHGVRRASYHQTSCRNAYAVWKAPRPRSSCVRVSQGTAPQSSRGTVLGISPGRTLGSNDRARSMDRGDKLTVSCIARKRYHGTNISSNSNVTRLPIVPQIVDQREQDANTKAVGRLHHHDEIYLPSVSMSRRPRRRRPRRSQPRPRYWHVAPLLETLVLLLLGNASPGLPFVLPAVVDVKADRRWLRPPRFSHHPAAASSSFVSATTNKAASNQVDETIAIPPADRKQHDGTSPGDHSDGHIPPRERFLVHRGKSADMIYRAPGTCRTRAWHQSGRCYAQACIPRRR